MGTSKELLIGICNKLQPYRPLAEGVSALIEEGNDDEATLQALLMIFYESMKVVKTNEEKDAFKQAIEAVQSIKDKEDSEHEQEMNDADDLLHTI